MIDKKKLTGVINDYLIDSDNFLVGVSVSTRNKVMVFIDGDKGVSISDCVRLSRHIESFFDREHEDYELDVSSVGIGSPLQMNRQYRNNIGRMIAVSVRDSKKVKGKLVEVKEDGIVVEKEKPKKAKSKEEPEDAKVVILFEDIQEAKIVPLFK
jgi:ribosome maturation factor RimP